ncbi:MAG: NAD(P)(+) transhydrogenase (Re/Si-specific) subunit beta [Clostridia bacterium]|nr:NAD(P)(+) transhydrogenase (Re/Si-specific) subunit beta [Clostridia bacterium]
MSIGVVNVVGLVLAAGIVWGIKMMSSPETAVQGNLLGAVCMAGSIILTLVRDNTVSMGVLWAAMAVGAAIGWAIAAKVAMIQMPQMVALLNGLGGGSSAIVSLLVLVNAVTAGAGQALGGFEKFTSMLGLLVGGVTLSGSLIAMAKLEGRITGRPIVFSGQGSWNAACMIGTIAVAILALCVPIGRAIAPAVAALALSMAYGVLFTIRVGGADMPITVSLLNSFSGLAASIAGLALGDALLIAVGAVVGASGLILTQIMCKAMNRTLMQVLTGRTVMMQSKKTGEDTAPPSGQDFTSTPESGEQPAPAVKRDYLEAVREARKVIIVPGYGMALAQAQTNVKALIDKLESNGAEVKIAIHPVAGRMPGHMNVLLAEVDVSYDQLFEMDQVNEEFKETDVAIVVGANDVVNPAANSATGTPIYGMPILKAYEAKHVLVFNLDTRPGYAGVQNPLYTAANATLLLGNAAETVAELTAKL